MFMKIMNEMEYYSLRGRAPGVDFREATIRGLAPDGGLYFPAEIPTLEEGLLENISSSSDQDIAFRAIRPFVGNAIPEGKLFEIVTETISFPFPLIMVNDSSYSLELFHGPTFAFKDVGARFMSRCLGYFVGAGEKEVTVLVATSGDTGGAVAQGFYGVEGVRVVILYPSGKVSSVQEKQLTTLGKNIHALEIDGSFDDCQRMVKQAFSDQELTSGMFLTSANSINVARWLPQQFYYLFAWKQWADRENPPVFCVPSGNFGNICAGLLAQRAGLPARHFIAACNANDVVTRFLAGGALEPGRTIATLSNAMDVGDPSNFSRILEMFGGQFHALKDQLSSFSIRDDETLDTIRQVWQDHHYLLDPHGAVAYAALQKYLVTDKGAKGIFLTTAHPVKFPDALEKAGVPEASQPAAMAGLLQREKYSTAMGPDYSLLKEYLQSMGITSR